MNPWDDVVEAPDHDALTELNKKFRDDLERDTEDFTKNWRCPSCGDIFPPIKNLLIDLPAYGCDKCKEKNPAGYKWVMTKTKVNNVSLDFMVYNQYDTPYCCLFAVVAAFDGARRLDGALHKVSESGPLDVIKMRNTYEDELGVILGYEGSRSYDGYDNLPLVLSAFRDYGISYFSETFLDYVGDTQPEPSVPRLYIDSFFKVDHTDILLVTRLIASGFPLVTGTRVGKLYFYLSAEQIYHCPKGQADAVGGHAFAIIGSGTAPYEKGEVETFYVVRNSKGERGHSCHHKEGFGGDFIIWAKDVRHIWGFYLPDSVLHKYIYCIKKD
ncbi:unnamed protein product [Urochloa humidicola]